MKVYAQRVGGSGHASDHLHEHFESGHISSCWDGHCLKAATLNLVLEVGAFFRTPIAGGATKQYVATNGETYYLQEIQLRVINAPTDNTSRWLLGSIHRNHPHPPKFDNLIEVIAPDLGSQLKVG